MIGCKEFLHVVNEVEKTDDDLLPLINSQVAEEFPIFNVDEAHCIRCISTNITILEKLEGDTGRCFYLCKCTDCGEEFIALERKNLYIKRCITNAENDIRYLQNKIEYLKKKEKQENGLYNN